MNILFDPNPFCFGSASTLRGLVEALPAGTSVKVLACGPVIDLCQDLDIVPLDVKDAAALRAAPDLLAWADLYVAISNNVNVGTVCDAGLPLAFVDVLFWMKRQRTPAMNLANAYVIERYPGVVDKLEEFPVPQATLVAPILRRARRGGSCRVPLLVNLGGASSPYLKPGVNTTYPQRVVDLVDEIARDYLRRPVEVAMGSEAARSVQTRPHAVPVTLTHDEYLDRLGRADVLLTAPGLNAPLEAFLSGVPVAWLPPQNLTQVFHLQAYVDGGLAPDGLSLKDLVPGFELTASLPESEGTRRVLEVLADLTDVAWQEVRARVEDQLNLLHRWPNTQVERQRAWLEACGGVGTMDAVAAILGAAA